MRQRLEFAIDLNRYAFAELLRQTRLRQSDQTTTKAWVIIRNVFDIIIPTLDIKSKSPLLKAIRALLDAAKGSPSHTNSAEKQPAATNETSADGAASNDQPAAPVAQMAPPSNTSHDSNLHSSLLPGFGTSNTNAVDPNLDPSIAGFDESMLGFDFDAIDWDEFDRLTQELCGQ